MKLPGLSGNSKFKVSFLDGGTNPMAGKATKNAPLQLSVIIVNYNVREFLHQALISLQKAMKGMRGEILVVDNASDDGSVEMVRERFPSVVLIANSRNVGFAQANNLALQKARGRYLLLINPDTLVQEDTLHTMVSFFEENPEAGLAGCKIINPDGSFQLPCRRSFPTPWVAFTKMSGLSSLVPNSRMFGRYNLTYLSPDETYELDAVSGSFMMIRREVFEQVGGLDEEFFMYGEDLDWCYRIQQAGWKNYYVHTTKIIHYKGESTKRSSIDEVRTFYNAMHLFVQKHFNQSRLFAAMLRLAISLSTWLALLKAALRPLSLAIIDIVVVDISLKVAEIIWFGEFSRLPSYGYPIIYIVPAVIVVASLYAAGVYTHRRMSVLRTMVATLVSFVIISALVFFFKDYGFSRGVTIIAGMLSILLLPLWRLLSRLLGKSTSEGRKSLFGRRTLIVGTDDSALEIYRRLRNRIGDGYDIIGFIDSTRKRIGEELSGVPILGSIDNIGKVIREQRVNEVIFSTQTLSYTEILSIISRTPEQSVSFHLVPTTMEVIIGKGSVDSLNELPLVQISYGLEKAGSQLFKRILDGTLSLLLLICGYPFVYLKRVLTGHSTSVIIAECPRIFSGAVSFVGPPMGNVLSEAFTSQTQPPLFLGKPAVTGLVQLQGDRALTREEIDQLNLYYAKNYTPVVDIEIILKTFLKWLRNEKLWQGAVIARAQSSVHLKTPADRKQRKRRAAGKK